MVTGTPSRSASACTISAIVEQRLQPGPRAFTSFIHRLNGQPNGALNMKLAARMPTTTPHEHGEQPERQHLPENDELGQRQRCHGHHEGQHGPERRALTEQGLHHGDDPGGIRIHRNADQNRRRHRPPRLCAHSRGKQFGRRVTVDRRPSRDAGDHPTDNSSPPAPRSHWSRGHKCCLR